MNLASCNTVKYKWKTNTRPVFEASIIKGWRECFIFVRPALWQLGHPTQLPACNLGTTKQNDPIVFKCICMHKWIKKMGGTYTHERWVFIIVIGFTLFCFLQIFNTEQKHFLRKIFFQKTKAQRVIQYSKHSCAYHPDWTVVPNLLYLPWLFLSAPGYPSPVSWPLSPH